MFAVLLLAGVLYSAHVPPVGILPDRKNGISTHLWQAYTEELLEKLFPDNLDRIAKIRIIIVDDGEVQARTDFVEETISMHSGLLLLVQDEHEYAFIIAHEVHHILNRREPTLWGTPWLSREHFFFLLRNQEIIADVLAQDTLRSAGMDTCAGARILGRFLRYYEANKNPRNPYTMINLRRKRILEYFCRQQQ